MEGLFYGDALDLLPSVQSGSVDMILCDLPYQKTQCRWDSAIPLAALWEHYWRVIKPNGAIVLHASQPFTTALISSCLEWFKYDLIWEKDRPSGFLNARKMPMKSHEDICVFYKKLPTYNPQMTPGKRNNSVGIAAGKANQQGVYGEYNHAESFSDLKMPRSVLKFARPHPLIHPTQKPVELAKWLINTYTNVGEMVLDNCAGSGTTGVAARELGRRFILMEKDEQIFQVAATRLAAEFPMLPLTDAAPTGVE